MSNNSRSKPLISVNRGDVFIDVSDIEKYHDYKAWLMGYFTKCFEDKQMYIDRIVDVAENKANYHGILVSTKKGEKTKRTELSKKQKIANEWLARLDKNALNVTKNDFNLRWNIMQQIFYKIPTGYIIVKFLKFLAISVLYSCQKHVYSKIQYRHHFSPHLVHVLKKEKLEDNNLLSRY